MVSSSTEPTEEEITMPSEPTAEVTTESTPNAEVTETVTDTTETIGE